MRSTKRKPVQGKKKKGKKKRIKKGSRKNTNINVAIRIRPLLENEKVENSRNYVRVKPNGNIVVEYENKGVMGGTRSRIFDKFTHVYTGSDQNPIFLDLGKNVVEKALSGTSVCLFAYGRTGSGKTFTMLGHDGAHITLFDKYRPLFLILPPDCIEHINGFVGDSQQRGLIFNIVNCLFIRLNELCNYHCVNASFSEIYNEKVRNLCADSDLMYYHGAEEKRVHTGNEALDMITQGMKNRVTRATLDNKVSSRSHALFTLSIDFRLKGGDEESGFVHDTLNDVKIHMIDLAGSERTGKRGYHDKRKEEGININKSLLYLGIVLGQLMNLSKQPKKWKAYNLPDNYRGTPGVSYKNSVLTEMLTNSLTLENFIVMIGCVSPFHGHIGETLNTMNYALRTQKIKVCLKKRKAVGWRTTLKRRVYSLAQSMRKLGALERRHEQLTSVPREEANKIVLATNEIATRINRVSDYVKSLLLENPPTHISNVLSNYVEEILPADFPKSVIKDLGDICKLSLSSEL